MFGRPKKNTLSLFRYQKFSEWLRPLIVDSQLYFPISTELNDPCEFSYKSKITWNEGVIRKRLEETLKTEPSEAVFAANPGRNVKEILRGLRENSIDDQVKAIKSGFKNITPEQLQELFESQMRIDAMAIGICSFTENANSGYMSFFYAQQHTGLCLEFDKRKEPFRFSVPVRYQSEAPTIDLVSGSKIEIQLARMCVKSTEWAQEREWRLINHRMNDGSLVKYDSGALISISLCRDFKEGDLKVLSNWLKERDNAGHHRPHIYRIHRVQGAYDLKRSPIQI